MRLLTSGSRCLHPFRCRCVTAKVRARASGDPLATVLAIAAVLLSLLAVIDPAATGRQPMRRDDRAKRSELYLELMELIERHGIWVVDQTHDLLRNWRR